MSQENFVKFHDDFLNQPANSALRATLDGIKTDNEFISVAIEQGKLHGFDFNADDLKAVIASTESKILGSEVAAPTVTIRSQERINSIQASASPNRELSEQELAGVAGGAMSVGSTVMCAW
jgi:hypothetical protein